MLSLNVHTVLLETAACLIFCVSLCTHLYLSEHTHTQPTGSVCPRCRNTHWNRSIRFCLSPYSPWIYLHIQTARTRKYLNDYTRSETLDWLRSSYRHQMITWTLSWSHMFTHRFTLSYTSYTLSFHQRFGSSFSNVRMLSGSIPRAPAEGKSFKQHALLLVLLCF